jgi:NADH dehydrogenase [ubiquinone] 1 alpha subcomplex assembly factor 7
MAESEARLSLKERIAARGPVTVAEFMEAAVGAYYAARDPLGAQGDFITAPEVSQMFGELLGLWCADLWQRLGAPKPVLLVELGPGRGTMMQDMLRAARTVPPFMEALQVHLVELSPVLRAAQAHALAPFAPQWHARFEHVPQNPMLLVANEFLDALPVHQYVRTKDGWRERMVALAGCSFAFAVSDAPGPDLGDAPERTVRELRPAADALARRIAERLRAHDGAALFIDYGHDGGLGDTLQAVRQHRRHDVLAAPGAADLTAHVDFAAFRAAAEAAGARAWGPAPQGDFLKALGIEPRAQALLAGASEEQAVLIRSGWRRLVDPSAMGRLFRALALTRPDAPPPAGFGP